jgi:hypothetical protein
MYNYIPGEEGEEPSEASGSVYTEHLPEDFEAGTRKSPRFHTNAIPQQAAASTHLVNVSLATGLTEWEDEQATLKESVRVETYKRKGDSVNKNKSSKAGSKSPEKEAVIPAHEHIWGIMENVRLEEEKKWAAGSKQSDSLRRSVDRHRITLRKEGVAYYVNKLMMQKILTMDAESQRAIKEMVEERFKVVTIGGDPRKWKVVSDDLILTDKERADAGLLYSYEDLES